MFFDQPDQAQIPLTLLLSARQDFLRSEEQKMTTSDKFTEGRENPFDYGFGQQVHTVGCLVKQNDTQVALLLVSDLVLNRQFIYSFK